jgi:dUTPase
VNVVKLYQDAVLPYSVDKEGYIFILSAYLKEPLEVYSMCEVTVTTGLMFELNEEIMLIRSLEGSKLVVQDNSIIMTEDIENELVLHLKNVGWDTITLQSGVPIGNVLFLKPIRFNLEE